MEAEPCSRIRLVTVPQTRNLVFGVDGECERVRRGRLLIVGRCICAGRSSFWQSWNGRSDPEIAGSIGFARLSNEYRDREVVFVI
jgi:hypothetical protein